MFQCPNCLRANHNDGLCNDCAPAPKEEGMDLVKTNCKTCGIPLLNSEVCYKCSDRAAERRALYREAYMEALPITTQFYLREQRFQAARMDAHRIALETVRQWDAMISQLDGGNGDE